MKRPTTIIMLAFCAVLLFFSLFGDAIYHLVTPDVTAYTVSAAVVLDGGAMKLTLPKECVRDGKVMLLESKPAFERAVFAVRSIDVFLSESEFYPELYLIESGLKQGDRVVLFCENDLCDGQRVEIG